jgi:RNA polymerase sigma-70 factor, ECF subfamily
MVMLPTTAATSHLTLEETFEDIVRLHQRRIYRILYLLLRDQDEADSLTQECFLRAYRYRAGFRGDAAIGTWLVRIAINLARDQLRSRRRDFWRGLLRGKENDSHLPADRGRSQEEALMAGEQAKAVWRAADRLPLKQKAVFNLRFAEEMSIQEIAEVMRLREVTVRVHLSTAIQAVRRGLEGGNK